MQLVYIMLRDHIQLRLILLIKGLELLIWLLKFLKHTQNLEMK